VSNVTSSMTVNNACTRIMRVCNCAAVDERRRIKLQQSEKDSEAMSLMQKMRVTWTSEEDSLVSIEALHISLILVWFLQFFFKFIIIAAEIDSCCRYWQHGYLPDSRHSRVSVNQSVNQISLFLENTCLSAIGLLLCAFLFEQFDLFIIQFSSARLHIGCFRMYMFCFCIFLRNFSVLV